MKGIEMDSIKEAMIHEEDTGERKPGLDPYRTIPQRPHDNPDEWARFMCRYVDARATCPNGIMHLSYEIVAAIDGCVGLPDSASMRRALKYIKQNSCERTIRDLAAETLALAPETGGNQTMKPTEIAAKLVGAWEDEFNVMSATENTDVALGELTRRIATALVGEPRADAEPSDVEGPHGCSTQVGRTAGLIPATGAKLGVPTLPTRLRAEAIRARDEHGNTDFYALLREAADEIERLLLTNAGVVRESQGQRERLTAEIDRLRAALKNISIGGIGEKMWTVDEMRAYAQYCAEA